MNFVEDFGQVRLIIVRLDLVKLVWLSCVKFKVDWASR